MRKWMLRKWMLQAACVCALTCGAGGAERIFRAPRLTRGNTNIFPVQPIDAAAWLTHPDFAHEGAEVAAPRLVRFRCAFTSDGAPLVFDVTADERFYLTLDGQFVARGPHRGSVDNWMYQSYRVPLAAGQHVMEAVVWKLGKAAPFAQLSHRLGFCLKAEGAYDAALTTGRGAWTCGALEGVLRPRGKGAAAGWFATGDTFELTGTGVLDAQPATWRTPAVVRDAFLKGSVYGHRRPGWMLYPSQLPDQTEDRVRPGRFVMGGEMTFPFTVPAGGKRHIRWDLDRYICAYPEAVVSGGKGGKMSWLWAESLCAPSKDPRDKKWYKGNRSAWKGKGFGGFGDTFVFDGRARAVFQPPWFRCGRWCELVIEAGAEPVTVEDLSLVESRYPLACETAFTSPDDPALADVQRIAVRTMQMCSHEMLFDCPFYEQQMYPGDTRVQLNVLSSMTSDDALIRRAIEIYDLNRRDDGSVPFNFPTRDTQEGAAYTLCYLGMYPDYVMYHTDRAWLRARLPGMRGTLSGFELYERADGLVENLPGWSFVDWVPRPGWEGGWAPGSRGGGANAELNLFYLAALQGAARVEDAMGNAHLAAHWREKAARLKPAIAAAFFDAARGLFASDAAHTVFSEHAQCLALLTDVFEGERAQALFDRLVATPDLCPTSVYFSYYLFEAYFKFRRPDLFLKRLDLWKGYVKLGASTCLEEPEYPGRDSRSDCHAWGAHPLWFLRTGVAGIRSDAPFFARVKVVPQPGPLTSLRASYPHPSGKPIAVDLAFAGGRARGTVTTPVAGTFAFGGETVALVPGVNWVGPVKTTLPAATRTLTVGAGADCATLEAALDRVAEIRKTDTTTPLAVLVAPGDYAPARPLAITHRHAQTNWAPLAVSAVDFVRKPRLLGGTPVTNWAQTAFNGRADVWCADVSALNLAPRPRLLFFNGRRMQPARWPNLDPKRPYTTGYAFADARGFPEKGARFSPTGLYEDEIQIRPADARRWAHPEDAWVIAYPRHNWWNRVLDVTNVANGVVQVKARHAEIKDRLFPWDRWCVENMGEELDRPGEWYYDARARKVYLLTPDGSDPNRAVVTVAKEGPILAIRGGNCTVAGLELAGGSAGVRIDHADQVDLLGCALHDIGFHDGTAVWIMGHRVRMADCDVHSIGGHGVFVQGFPKERRVDDRLDVVVENNYVHHCGEINSHGIGIWITGQGVRVSHNLVHDMPRCGLFGYGRFCEISYNRVRHVNTINDDTGALYGGGWVSGTGTKVCYNWFSDSIGFQRQRDGTYRLHKGACGIYPDEGCGGLAVYGNLVENCHHVAMHLHNGRWITISNNVFISNGALPAGKNTAQLSLQTWNANTNGYFVHDRRADIAREYHAVVDADPRWLRYPAFAQAPDNDTAFSADGTTMMGVEVKNNVIAYPGQGEGLMLRAWGLNTKTNFFDRNVYWPGASASVRMGAGQKGGDGWAAWRATGQDARSVVADPLFRDAAKGDWRLRPESPAFKLGFAELPYGEMGLRRTRFRPELPQEAEGVREHPEWLRDTSSAPF